MPPDLQLTPSLKHRRLGPTGRWRRRVTAGVVVIIVIIVVVAGLTGVTRTVEFLVGDKRA